MITSLRVRLELGGYGKENTNEKTLEIRQDLHKYMKRCFTLYVTRKFGILTDTKQIQC
jgi:hypothetical protein